MRPYRTVYVRAILPVGLMLLAAGWLGATSSARAQHTTDIMVQLQDNQLVTGVSDLLGENFTIPARTFTGGLVLHAPSSTFRGTDPGFYALTSDIFPLPVDELPVGADLMWDILPMTSGAVVSNLMYWDGLDDDQNGLDANDVELTRPNNAIMKIIENGTFTADASDQFVTGGLVASTAFDGTFHEHPQYRVESLDSTPSVEGVYVVSLQLRMQDRITSDPFFLAIRSPSLSDNAADAAADWIEDNIEMLTSPPILSGDYNNDGTVSLADFSVWRDTLNSTTNLQANGDDTGASMGLVDQADYAVWLQHFGESALSAAGLASSPRPVPEPATLVAAICLAMGLVFHSRSCPHPA